MRQLMQLVSMLVLLLLPAVSGRAQDPFSEPLESVRVLRAEHLVSVRLLGFKQGTAGEEPSTLELELRTRSGVHLYTKNLAFRFADSSGFERELAYSGEPEPTTRYDNWYKEVRSFFSAGTIFRVGDGKPLSPDGLLRMRFEACNVKMCLMPTTYRFALKPGTMGTPEAPEELVVTPGGAAKAATPEPIASPVLLTTALPSVTPAPVSASVPAEPVSISDSLNRFLQRELQKGGMLLLPLLFLAGLAMNLTPCVYPMIPITLSVLGRFRREGTVSKKGGRKALLPAIYVLGVAFSYSTMGVVAGMTGGLFGSLLQSSAVNVGIALLMFALGFTMLGLFDLSRLQSLGSRIPLSNRSPAAAVFVMGGVSGLVSAPCTGPVLASLLLLVGQTRDPLQGFVLLFVFALGFGSPYLVLGTLSQRVARLPRLGFAEELVKFAFAALMFALALYYLRSTIGRMGFAPLFQKPSEIVVGTAMGLALLLALFLPRLAHNNGAKTLWRLASTLFVLLLTSLSLWLTLWTLKAFPSASHIRWVTGWDEAMRLAQIERRPIVVDLWADWCASCKEMDATLWKDPEVVSIVENHFVAVKLDFTEETPMSRWFTQTWELGGLPAVGFFLSGSDLQGKPSKLFREKLEKNLFLETAREMTGAGQ